MYQKQPQDRFDRLIDRLGEWRNWGDVKVLKMMDERKNAWNENNKWKCSNIFYKLNEFYFQKSLVTIDAETAIGWEFGTSRTLLNNDKSFPSESWSANSIDNGSGRLLYFDSLIQLFSHILASGLFLFSLLCAHLFDNGKQV